MLVGLDLDGTIVIYDEIFHRLATERLGMPGDAPAGKTAVRDWVRALPDGEQRWIELQGLVYGPLMEDAPPANGLDAFLRGCADGGVDVVVISHRTPRSVADEAVDLHASARDWLEHRGFVFDGVFLEPTRAAKLARIGREGCDMFVDDLEEVLLDPAFPATTERWLYSPAPPERTPSGVRVFSDWRGVLQRAFELKAVADAR